MAEATRGDVKAMRSLLEATPSWLKEDADFVKWRVSWAERLLAVHDLTAFGAALGYCGKSGALLRQRFLQEAKSLAASDAAQQAKLEQMVLEACR